jgi:hypothetical protein
MSKHCHGDILGRKNMNKLFLPLNLLFRIYRADVWGFLVHINMQNDQIVKNKKHVWKIFDGGSWGGGGGGRVGGFYNF